MAAVPYRIRPKPPRPPKLSELEIDVDRDWGTRNIINFGPRGINLSEMVLAPLTTLDMLTKEQLSKVLSELEFGETSISIPPVMPAGAYHTRVLGFDGRYLYAANWPSGHVFKIDPISKSIVKTSPEMEDHPVKCAFTKDYIYGLFASDLVKFNQDLTPLSRLALPESQAEDFYSTTGLVFDGQFLYTSSYLETRTPINKIDPKTMEVLSTLNLPSPYGYQLAFDGSFLYCAHYTSPGSVTKIDPLEWTYTTLTLGTGQDSCSCITTDGFYIYVGVAASFQVLQINPRTMTVVRTLNLNPDDEPAGLFFDGTYLYLGVHRPSPQLGPIYRIHPETLSITRQITVPGFCDTMATDGFYIYLGLRNASESKILRRPISRWF
jgi:hypothetical protein